MNGGKWKTAGLAALACFAVLAGDAQIVRADSDNDNNFVQKHRQRFQDKLKAKQDAKKLKKKAAPAIVTAPPSTEPEPVIEPEEPVFSRKLNPPKKADDALTSSHSDKPKGVSTTSTEVVADKGIKPMVSEQSASWLDTAIERYQRIAAAGGWPKVSGRLKPGSSGDDVARLKRRLHAEGYLTDKALEPSFITEFTDSTEKAVKLFQANNGLKQTGWTDKPTLAALNVSVNQRLATMRANTARVAAYTQDLGGRYIVVNIPALQAETVSSGQVYSRHNVIVGKPDRPSPVVMTKLQNIIFNPYWNVPVSIVERDIIPRILKEGVKSLDAQNIKVFDGYGGPEITDTDSIDWATTPPDRYHLRQEPGADNAMAAMKINFPSPFGVYMHDTPLKRLFAGSGRYLSSGCVRVEKVAIMADWILNGQDGWNSDRIASMEQSLVQEEVPLQDPPQVRWVYLTAWADEKGFVHFRDDIYDLDGSGFTVGQPLPVGEVSDEGQRYVLKMPPAEIRRAVDDDFLGTSAAVSTPAKKKVSRTTVKDDEKVSIFTPPGQKTKAAVLTESAAKKKPAAKKPADEKTAAADGKTKTKAAVVEKKPKTAAVKKQAKPTKVALAAEKKKTPAEIEAEKLRRKKRLQQLLANGADN